MVGITTKHLSSIESGNAFVSAEVLESLSMYLEVSVSALFYSETEQDGGDGLLSKVDSVIDEELIKAITTIKLRLRALNSRDK